MSSRKISCLTLLLGFAFSIWSGLLQATPTTVLFQDKFDDGILSADWSYQGRWKETRGRLAARRQGQQTVEAIASSFMGCAGGQRVMADMELHAPLGSGTRNSLSLLAWYADNKSYLELAMKDRDDIWILRQYVNGKIKAKRQVHRTIDSKTNYHVEILFDGTSFQVLVAGQFLATMPAVLGSNPAGSVGFRVKGASGYFDNLSVSTIVGPIISIDDVTTPEGDAGITQTLFTVSLSTDSALPVKVSYETQDGSADASDYGPASGTLVIPAGQTTASIAIGVIGDTTGEGQEDFFVNLSDPENGTIGDGQGEGTILSEEPLCQTITVNPTSLPSGTTGSAYGPVSFSQTGGTAPVIWDRASGNLPSGMSFSAAGALAGTPTVSGTFSIDFRVTDANGCVGTRALTLVINCPGVSVNPATLADGLFGVAYGPVSFSLAGGTPPSTWQLIAGPLPTGMNLSNSGILSGTPTQGGVFPLTIEGTDSNGCVASQAMNLQINQAPAITSSNSTTFAVGVAGSFTVTATGTPAPTFSATGLPAWATLNPTTGILSGTPPDMTGSPFSIVITAQNGVAPDATQNFTLTVTASPVITSADNTTFQVATAGSFTVTATGNPAPTFSATGLPAWANLNATSGVLSGTPPDTTGSPFTIQITAQNGVPPDATQSFTLTVTQPAPIAVDDTVTVAGNIRIAVAAPGVLGNDTVNGATISAFDAVSTNGGTVVVNADGSYTYDPPAGYEGSDTFTYTLTNGAGSDTATVTATISGMIWFIDNNAASPGNGRLSSPFNTLAAFQAVNDGVGNHPAANENIFLYESAIDYAGPVTLLSGQKLIGQDATASLSTITGITPPAGSLALPAMNSGNATIVNITSSTDGVTLGTGTAVRGLTLGNCPNGTRLVGSTVGSIMVTDASINGTGAALAINTAALNMTFGAIGSSSTTGGRRGIDIQNASGTFTVNGASTITGSNNDAIGLQNNTARFNFNSVTLTTNGFQGFFAFSSGTVNVNSGTINTTNARGVNIASTALGVTFTSVTVNNNAGRGIDLQSNTGSITVGNLQATTVGGEAMFITSSGSVGIAAGNVAATNAAAAGIGSTTLNVSLASLSSTNSPGMGVNLSTVAGSFVANGGTITGAAGTAFNISGGNATITYGGSITQTTAAQRLIDIQNRTGAAVTFQTGTLTAGASSTGVNISGSAGSASLANLGAGSNGSRMTNTAVTLSSNTGTFTFANTTIFTNGVAGLSSTNGGTLNFTGSGNTIDTTNSTALNISGTALGITLQSVSASNAASGIVLTNTTGSFAITGTGSTDGSGGTIQNITGSGIVLTNTTNVSLANMTLSSANTTDAAPCSFADNSGCNAAIKLNTVTAVTLSNVDISNSAQTGINGMTVSGFAFNGGTITNTGTAANEDGIDIRGLTGSCSIQSSTISSSAERNVLIRNASGTLTQLTIDNSTISATSNLVGQQGVLVDLPPGSTGSATLTVTGSTISNSKSDGMRINNEGNGTANVSVSSTNFQSNNVGLNLTGAGALGGDMTFNISGNTFSNTSTGVNVSHLGGGGNAFTGRINNNQISATGANRIAMWVVQEGNGGMTVEIKGNTVSQFDDAGIDVESRGGSGFVHATIQNNTIGGSGTNGLAAMFLRSGNGTVGETNTLCVNLASNTASVAGASFPIADYYLDRFNSPATTFNLQGFGGSTPAQAQAFVISTDTASGSRTAFAESGVYGAATCSTVP